MAASIVLTDWQMPEMEGPELCRAIREENPDHYVFIVMLTSRGSKDDIISGLHETIKNGFAGTAASAGRYPAIRGQGRNRVIGRPLPL